MVNTHPQKEEPKAADTEGAPLEQKQGEEKGDEEDWYRDGEVGTGANELGAKGKRVTRPSNASCLHVCVYIYVIGHLILAFKVNGKFSACGSAKKAKTSGV